MKKIFITFLYISARIIVWIAVIALIYNCGLKAYDFGYRVFAEKPVSSAPGKDYSVIIHKGDSDYKIGKMLKEKGLIKDAMLFVVQSKVYPYGNKMKAGRYTLNTSMTAREMIAVLGGEKTDSEESGNAEE